MSGENKKSNANKKKPWRGRGGYFGGKSFNFERKKLDPEIFLNQPPSSSSSTLSKLFYNRIPYKGWRYYFPDEGYDPLSDQVVHCQAVERFFARNKIVINLKDLEDRRYFNLDYKSIISDEDFLSEWSSFKDDLVENSEKTINCLGLAFHQMSLVEPRREALKNMTVTLQDLARRIGLVVNVRKTDLLAMIVVSKYISETLVTEDSPELPSIKIRLHNFEPIFPIKEIKAALFGKLISIRGTVIRVSASKLICVSMGFGCNTCFGSMCIQLKDGLYKLPKGCSATDGCRSRSFTPLCSSPLTQTKSYQIMKIQESIADEMSEGGRVPRTIEVDMTDDLVDSCGPGDNVTITGIVKVRSSEDGKKSKSANLFALYVQAVAVVNTKSGVNSGRQSHCNVEFSIKDYYAIQEIHSEESRFRLLVNSLCPTVYGHEMVKAGLLLSLVGGSGGNRRPDIHVLVVGDPGLGKSHLLHAAAQVSPRGVYVCGNTTSSSGLTVTLVKEGGGDFALEAGALVLANHGSCCIDEFDKMTSQHQALLEAMEQQRISVAKGGVVCSLPAHASIIAAANPAGGHYNRTRTVAENLKMGSPLLSRFDLIFILLDRPDERMDSLLSEHVMTLHAGLKGKKSTSSANSHNSSFLIPDDDQSKPLSDRLKLRYGEPVDLVPHSLLRKYIAYVRKYLPSPRLSPEAGAVLQGFYLELRRLEDSTPITTRQLESMIRLTQARAKLELREEATASDANDIVQLMKWSMRDVVTGNMDPLRSQNAAGMSQGSKAKRFIAALQSKANLENRDTFSVKELKEVVSLLKLQVPDFYQFISVLNVQGFIIKKGSNTYQLLSL